MWVPPLWFRVPGFRLSPCLVKAALAQGISPFEVSQIRQFVEEVRRGVFAVGEPTKHVEEVTGRPAEDFESIARRYVNNPELIVHGYSAGTKLGAILGMVKMMLTRLPDFDRWEAERGHPMLAEPQFAIDNPEWMASAEKQELALLDPRATGRERAAST